VVLDALTQYYEKDNSNIHRGAHTLADRATSQYEETRESVRTLLNARESAEVIFTRGTTESINLVAKTFSPKFIQKGDEILISTLEHHSNIVPWQMLCEQTGAILKVIPITDSGELVMDEFEKLLSSKTKLISIVHASNALGTINPVKKIIDVAHAVGAKVLLDGAQSASHLEVDVQELDCDFMAFSAHKLYGPTGLGVLYGKRELLEETGFDVKEEERWYFIGTLTGSKFVDSIHPCFAVDITGIEPGEPQTDGSEQERLSKFTLVPANDIISIEDPFISALFLRIFKYVVGMDIYNREDSIFSKKKEINTEI
jgi:selenocysteine lyase/cysteine desulfurase